MDAHDLKNKMLVQLDALLDLRIGAIAKQAQPLVETVLTKGWVHRTDDYHLESIEGLDYSTYLSDLKKDDFKVLQGSLMTRVLDYLNDIFRDAVQLGDVNFNKTDPELIINTHPYTLTPEEKTTLEESILFYLPYLKEVKFNHISPQMLTPAYLGSMGISLWVTYHFTQWFELYEKTLMECPITEVTIVAPALYRTNIFSEEELKKLKDSEQELDAFAITEMTMSLYCTVRFIKAYWFSLKCDIGRED